MSSNLACVGLGIESGDELEEIVRRIIPRTKVVGRAGDLEVRRWEDPGGARLVLRVRGGEIIGFVPSFAGAAGATFADVRQLNDDTWSARLIDGEETATVAAIDLEEGGLFAGKIPGGRGAVVALGQSVRAFADAAEFAASEDSMMGSADTSGEPPEMFREHGWAWPPRMGPESFMSPAAFGAAAEANADARLAGTVLSSSRRRTVETGQDFFVARVRTVGMEVDLCLATDEHVQPPDVGSTVHGYVYLVASIHAELPSKSILGRFGLRAT